ncbi:MAG: SDR family oxidoreductase [Candidatus Eremiobacteraeota bacterium]|nr:SDR family oxidoreductase [Candidatus Eremiobacteraeota bacterium]
MRVLVTGGGGYIGCVLCDHLIRAGHSPVVLDRFFWGRRPLAGVRVEEIVGDIRDLREEWFDGIEAVVHLAGLSNDPTAEYNPEANWQMNAVGTERLVELCKRRGIERFTYASSASLYDTESSANEPERSPIMCDESTEIAPRGAYSLSKRHGEEAILAAADGAFAPVIFRQGTVYGWSPRMRFDLVVNTFIKDASMHRRLFLHGGGWMWRPLVDVSDVARVHVMALEAPLDAVRGQIFNVLEENYQIRQLAMLVAGSFALRDVRVELVEAPLPSLVRNYRISNAKLSRALGFTPSVTVLESIERMISQLPGALEELAHPQNYNVRWMALLEEMHALQRGFRSIY